MQENVHVLRKQEKNFKKYFVLNKRIMYSEHTWKLWSLNIDFKNTYTLCCFFNYKKKCYKNIWELSALRMQEMYMSLH